MEAQKRKASGAPERPDKRRKEDGTVADGVHNGADTGGKVADIAKSIRAQLCAQKRSLTDATIDELADILVSTPQHQKETELVKILDLMTQARPNKFQAPNLTAIREWWFHGYTIRWQHKATYMSQLIRNGAHCPLFAPSSRRVKEAPLAQQAELLQDAIRVSIAAKALGDTPATKVAHQTRLPLWDLGNDDRFSEYPSSYQLFLGHEGPGPVADPRESTIAQATELARAEWEEYRHHTGLEYHNGLPSLKVIEEQFVDGVKIHSGPLRWSEMHSKFPDGGRDLATDMFLDDQKFERLRKMGKIRNDVTASMLPQYRSQVPDEEWDAYSDDQYMGEAGEGSESQYSQLEGSVGEDLPPNDNGNQPAPPADWVGDGAPGYDQPLHFGSRYLEPPRGQPRYNEPRHNEPCGQPRHDEQPAFQDRGHHHPAGVSHGRRRFYDLPPFQPYDPERQARSLVHHQAAGHGPGDDGYARDGLLGQMTRAFDDLEVQNRHLADESQELKEKNRGLSDKNTSLSKENSDLRFEIENHLGEVEDLVGQVKRLKRKCKRLKDAPCAGESARVSRGTLNRLADRIQDDNRSELKKHENETRRMITQVLEIAIAARVPDHLRCAPSSSGSDSGDEGDDDRRSEDGATGSGKSDADDDRNGSGDGEDGGDYDGSGQKSEAPGHPEAGCKTRPSLRRSSN